MLDDAPPADIADHKNHYFRSMENLFYGIILSAWLVIVNLIQAFI